MKLLKSIFHFLGGIYLAIALIAIAAITVVAGTLIESKTESHLLAAQWTYANPFFLLLLSLFFINILFSALRRWPFKKKHIPFLITHLGLLMIISGTIIKNRFGLQGQLTVWEGSGSQHVLQPHTHALLIEEKDQSTLQMTPQNSMIALDSFRPHIYYPYHFPEVKCKVIGYAPHVKEVLETWIKGSKAYIAGFPSVPVHDWNPTEPFPEADSYHFALATHSSTWSILALRTAHLEEALQHAYLQNLNLQIKTKDVSSESLNIPLQKAIQNSVPFSHGNLDVSLSISTPLLEKQTTTPTVNFTWKDPKINRKEIFKVPLQGQDALLVKSHSKHGFEVPFIVDLNRPNPLLLLIEDEQGNTFLFAFDSYGRLHEENFSSSQLQTLIAYEQGFGGYGVQAVVPIPSFPAGREDKEKADAYQLTMQLRQALAEQQLPLSPPLQFFEQACQKAQIDFSSAFIQFLVEWNAHSDFLYSSQAMIPEQFSNIFKHFNWHTLSNNDKQTIQWTRQLLNQLEESWKEGHHPLSILERHHWPFIEELRKNVTESTNPSLLNLLAQQISSLIGYLPAIDFPTSPSNIEQARLLTAYFRAYGIDYRSLFPHREDEKEQFDHLENYWKEHSTNAHSQQSIVFETPLSHRIVPEVTPLKPEDCRPGIVLEVQEDQNKQTIALAYESSGSGFKWPILNGNYVIRFQPKLTELPYRIRLRQARQIFYPQSQQVYSYESDVMISEKGKPPIEQTLSMNHVHETWDGYRFYLAGIGNSADLSLKRIQLAVNHDPAKYFLTYPGAILVFLGAL